MHIHCMDIIFLHNSRLSRKCYLNANMSQMLAQDCAIINSLNTEGEVREGLNIYRSHARRIIHARLTGMVLFLW